MTLKLPAEVENIIDTLENNGFDAYAVGGCVRDMLLCRNISDWDICTNALPEEIKKSFEHACVIDTGIKHGTVTLMLGGTPYEITAFRADGTYSDGRHPDKVTFVRTLAEDLSRRDFTVNAMAFNPKSGLVDLFGGQRDIKNKIIRAVGNATERFSEDGLRIMRALRFASVLGFKIEYETAQAVKSGKHLLKKIAAERVSVELTKLITGENAAEILTEYSDIICYIIPEIKPTVGFAQNNPYHCYDVYGHTAKAVQNAADNPAVCLAVLFHDIAKPECYSEKDGIGHFYGHPKKSAEIAENILKRLKYSNETIDTVTELILYHDTEIKTESKAVKKWLNKIGEKTFRLLLKVKYADAMAKALKFRDQALDKIELLSKIADEILAENQCFSLKDLAVNGNDLIGLGMKKGETVGETLNKLLNMVIDETAENDRDILLKTARQIIGGGS